MNISIGLKNSIVDPLKENYNVSQHHFSSKDLVDIFNWLTNEGKEFQVCQVSI